MINDKTTIYRQAAQIAMLRDALATILHIEGSGMAVASIVKAHKALNATQSPGMMQAVLAISWDEKLWLTCHKDDQMYDVIPY